MTSYLYEKDLREMKYRILTSPRHDRAVREIAGMLGAGVQEVRRALVARLDMQYMENLPARYEAFLATRQDGDACSRALGADLFLRHLPMADNGAVAGILTDLRKEAGAGEPGPDALERAKGSLREVVLR